MTDVSSYREDPDMPTDPRRTGSAPAASPRSPLTSGSLCMGYGGLDIAVEEVLGAETVWCSEIDPYACTVIAQRWPQVTNHGDLKLIDWASLEPVDILTAGYPCQPFSSAGKRKGSDDPRHLWPYVADAIRHLRPELIVLENVAGHASLGLDAVLGDLAALGFDAEWGVIPASDIGACHQRARLFIAAWSANANGSLGHAARGAGQAVHEPGADERPRRRDRVAAADTEDGIESRESSRDGRDPAVVSSGARTGRGDRARDLAEGIQELGRGAGVAWGPFEAAIRRHERVLGRPAPAPTDERGRLSHYFVEWMQMLPEGHVTRVEHMKRNPALKLLGNGVVPPQAAYAIRHLLEREAVAA